MPSDSAEPLTSFVPALAMLLLSLGLGLAALFANRLLARGWPAPEPNPPFEHGALNPAKTWVKFRVRYVVLALLFVAFDMEMVFMFPWAAVFREVGLVAFADMFVFVAILTSALVLAWKEGAFDWEG